MLRPSLFRMAPSMARTMVLVLVLLLAAGCSSPEPSGGSQERYDLPFGLVQPEGTRAVGPPFDGVVTPTDGSATGHVSAAFWAQDAEAAYSGWVEQLRHLECADSRTQTTSSGGPDAWARVTTRCVPREGLGGSEVRVEVWNTEPTALIILDAESYGDAPLPQVSDIGRQVAVATPPDWSDPPPPIDSTADRPANSELFEEQGVVIHVPDGTVALTPTIPVPNGSGGSFAVLASRDPEATIRAMQREATSGVPEEPRDRKLLVGPPKKTEEASITADWALRPDGWGFYMLATQVPNGDDWVIQVRSNAD